MNDTDLIERFESAALTGADFPHSEHVRVAWIYLRDRPLIEVLERFPRHLRILAGALGAPELYNETITWFFILLVHDRMARGCSRESWGAFKSANPDLFERSGDIMNRYYTNESWRSESAKRSFLLPDKTVPLPAGVDGEGAR